MSLTTAQQAIVDAPGNFLLLACPGSGKTRSAAARVARLARDEGEKVAVCSYTNVGVERIGGAVARAGVVFDREHFLGTLHGFLLRYVLFPFGHLLGAEQGPSLRWSGWPDEIVGGDQRKRIPLDAFRRDPDGNLIVCNKPRYILLTDDNLIEAVGQKVKNRKEGLFKKWGAVSSDDAMWYALRILREYPELTAAVAGRFDELLIDEAQDTSELQLACLDELLKSGRLESLVLVGDLEQSICSFQGASAEGCRKLAEDRGLQKIPLNENHRCSQMICDVAEHFCARPAPDTAVGPSAACNIHPEVLLYPDKDLPVAMEMFGKRLEAHGIAPPAAAVLARTWSVVHRLNGEENVKGISDRARRLAGVVAARDGGKLSRRDLEWLQRLIAWCLTDDEELSDFDANQRRALRVAAQHLLAGLPAVEGDVRSWLRAAAAVLQATLLELADTPKHTGGRTLPAGSALAGHDAQVALAPPVGPLRAQTVHDIKGEDREAVMLVVHRPHGSDPTGQMALWEVAVTGGDVDEALQEERRINFVALTRAERYCLVALPDTDRGRKLKAACLAAGFVEAPV